MTVDTSHLALGAELSRLSRELDSAQRDLVTAEDQAARARHRADLAEARAFIGAEGSVEIRKRLAFEATEVHQLDAAVAEAGVRAARSRLSVLRSRIDTGRSLYSASRAAMQSFPGVP
jgi:hypothetical protein